jgi:hypothetical protein
LETAVWWQKHALHFSVFSHQTSFHDVTDGSNVTPDTICGYLCTAEPGYHGPTGLGTPNGLGGF